MEFHSALRDGIPVGTDQVADPGTSEGPTKQDRKKVVIRVIHKKYETGEKTPSTNNVEVMPNIVDLEVGAAPSK